MTKKELETAIENAVKEIKEFRANETKQLCINSYNSIINHMLEKVQNILSQFKASTYYILLYSNEIPTKPNFTQLNDEDKDFRSGYMFLFLFIYNIDRYETVNLKMLSKFSYDDFYYELEGEFLQESQTKDEDTEEFVRNYDIDTFYLFLKQICKGVEYSDFLQGMARNYINYRTFNQTKFEKLLEDYKDFISFEKTIIETPIITPRLSNLMEKLKPLREFLDENFQYNAEIHEDRFKDTLNREIYIFQNFAQKLNENIEKYIEKQKDTQND